MKAAAHESSPDMSKIIDYSCQEGLIKSKIDIGAFGLKQPRNQIPAPYEAKNPRRKRIRDATGDVRYIVMCAISSIDK
jgi:hypothetical protein